MYFVKKHFLSKLFLQNFKIHCRWGVAINVCVNVKNNKENVNVNSGTKVIMFLGVVSS